MKIDTHLIGLACCLLGLSLTGCAPMMSVAAQGRWQAQQPPGSDEASRNNTPTAQDPARAPAPATEYFTPTAAPAPKPTGGVVFENAGKRVSLNLQDAEVRSVVAAVLGDVLKLNYTVAPQVTGRVTLRTGAAIEPQALLAILESALASVSAALVETDGSYHVIPLDAAPSRARALVRNGSEATVGYAIEVIPLRHARARELQKLLDTIGPKGAVLLADEQHNHLVIGGTRQDRAALARTIAGFDVDGMRGMVFALFRLEQIGAEQVVNELRQIFGAQQELLAPGLRLLPLERMQAVIGIARNSADLETIDNWIRRLDTAPKTGERSLRVYNVQNGSARELASSLQLVLTGEGVVGTAAARDAASPQPAGTPEAARMAPIVTPSIKSASRIVANEENNSLLVFSTESEWRVLREALGKLDVMPRQVMIEAILAEVSLNDSLRYGVQWFFESGGKSATLSTNDQGKIAPQFPGFSYFYPRSDSARAVVNALQSYTDVKVLSAPRLAVLNNQKASLQVGDEVPVRTQTSQAVGTADAPVISTIAMRDTGVLLEVTPRVNDNGNVILEVTQEVSDVATTTSSGIDSPTIQRRRLRSVIGTRDGATVALGGLIRENSQRGNSGVPVLKDLPAIGNIFRDNTRDTRRTELVILLVPRVMRNHSETDAVVDALLDAMQSAAGLASHAARLKQKPAADEEGTR